jgi:HSP20 family protein
MTSLTRREPRVPLDIFDWLEAPWTVLHPVSGHPVRMEDFVTDGRYVVRAELPGLDPEKDIEVKVSKGILTIEAERHEETQAKHHSEFRYGKLTRSVTLPEGADVEHVDAMYDNGILEVRVPLPKESAETTIKSVPVRMNRHIKPS